MSGRCSSMMCSCNCCKKTDDESEGPKEGFSMACMCCNTVFWILFGFWLGLGLTRVLPIKAFDWMGDLNLFKYSETFEVNNIATTHVIPLKGELEVGSEITVNILFGAE